MNTTEKKLPTIKFFHIFFRKDSEYAELSYTEKYLYAFLAQKSFNYMQWTFETKNGKKKMDIPMILMFLEDDHYYIEMLNFPYSKLTEITGLSIPTLWKAFNNLKKKGFVKECNGKYRIKYPAHFVMEPDGKEALYIDIGKNYTDVNVSCFSRVLYALIKGFPNGCNAKNESLARFCAVDEKKILNTIYQLRKKGLLYRNLKTGYFEFGEKPLSRAKQVKLMSWDISAERVQSGCPY